DDLICAPNSGRDLPPIQQPVPFGATGPSILKRASEGNYSWLATIVTDPTMSALSSKVTVSVAVFYKRDLGSNPNNTTPLGAGETFLGVGNSPNLASGEIMFSDANLTIKPVKSGQWLMLSGTPGLGNNYYRWYRVAAADAVVLGNTPTQYVTVAGPDWNVPANATAAWVFETVVAVYEKNMRLEIP
ncbi:MAG: hypothetical protein HY288_09065, partial [Planctomycetia bacterium]|nr:hypothetical protein [Planctomycetia bacterium]